MLDAATGDAARTDVGSPADSGLADSGLADSGVADASDLPDGAVPAAFAPDAWALSGPRSDGFDVVLFAVPDDPSAPVTDVEVRVDGTWRSLGARGPGSYPVAGLVAGRGYSVAIRAVSARPGPASAPKGIACVPDDPAGFRGWDPQVDLGVAGEWFVAPYGDDAAAGTSAAPLRTVGRALAMASSGDRIKVRAGTYRERLTLRDGVIVEGYGTERPEITAAEPLLGLTQCSAADAPVIGSTLGVAGSPVYKTRLSAAHFEYGDPLALNLREVGETMHVASDRADYSNLFAENDESTFHLADRFVLNGANQVIAIVDASVINPSNYTNAQLIGTSVLLYHFPNVVSRVRITAADVANNRITVDGNRVVEGNTATPAAEDLRYAISNIGAKLRPGTFYVATSGSEFEVYVYPGNPEHISLIEYSARTSVVELGPSSTHGAQLRGVHLSRASGDSYAHGSNLYKGSSAYTSDGNLFEHVLSTGAHNSGDIARSFFLRGMSNTTVRRCSFYEIGGRGVFFAGRSLSLRGSHNMVERSFFHTIGGAGFLAYSEDRIVFAHNYADRTGLVAHSNKSNAYEQIDGVAWWGNEFTRATQGYLTWQEASSPVVAFNLLAVSSKYLFDERTIVDQQNGTPPPVARSNGYIFNNTIPPQPMNTGARGHLAITLFSRVSDIRYTVANNVTQGLTAPADFPAPGTARSNVITDLGWDGVRVTSPADYDATNTVETDLSRVYRDYAAADFSPPAGSPILTTVGQDMRAVVTTLQAMFPQFTGWDRDYRDAPIDWSRLPVGADASLAFVRP